MESQGQGEQGNQPSLCAAGCGFFGSSDTQGFCSVCWRGRQSQASQALQQAAAPQQPEPKAEPQPAEQPAEAPAPPAADALPAAAPEAAAEAAAEPAAPEKPVQENRGRCFCCRKKVGLLGFECRCGYVFCSGHRHATDHNCSFDYAAMDKAHLAKANTKVVAAKIDKL